MSTLSVPTFKSYKMRYDNRGERNKHHQTGQLWVNAAELRYGQNTHVHTFTDTKFYNVDNFYLFVRVIGTCFCCKIDNF